jgi:hypothetical protein
MADLHKNLQISLAAEQAEPEDWEAESKAWQVKAKHWQERFKIKAEECRQQEQLIKELQQQLAAAQGLDYSVSDNHRNE